MDNDIQEKLVKKEFLLAHAYASEYLGKHPMSHLFNTRLKRVSELLVDSINGKVLDVGCGPAIIANTFRGKPVEYYGIDLSWDMIKECKGRYGNDTNLFFLIGKLEKLPFVPSLFNVVLCLGVFEYVLDGRAAMKEIKRVLKPGGTFIVTMQNEMSPYRLWQRFVYWKIVNGIEKFFCLTSRGEAVKGVRKPKSVMYRELPFRRLITSCGMEIEDVVYYDFNMFFSPLDTLLPSASVNLSQKLEFLNRSKLRFLATGYILKCRNT